VITAAKSLLRCPRRTAPSDIVEKPSLESEWHAGLPGENRHRHLTCGRLGVWGNPRLAAVLWVCQCCTTLPNRLTRPHERNPR
jgi:hypothetical protein